MSKSLRKELPKPEKVRQSKPDKNARAKAVAAQIESNRKGVRLVP